MEKRKSIIINLDKEGMTLEDFDNTMKGDHPDTISHIINKMRKRKK